MKKMKFILNRESLLLENLVTDYLTKNEIEENDDISEIRKELRNNQNYIIPAIKFYSDGISVDRILKFFSNVKKYKQLLSSNGFILLDEFSKLEEDETKKMSDIFEILDDEINNLALNNDRYKFMNKFISSKYRFLIDERTPILFNSLKEIVGDDHKKIEDLLISKIASYRNPDQFNDALNGLIEQLSSSNEELIENIESEGGKIVYSDSDSIVVDVKEDFNIMCKIGSQKWCIVRDESYFDSYVKFPNKQYIVLDLTKDNSDSLRMLGVTIGIDGKSTAAHDMEDKSINKSVFGKWLKYMKPISVEELVSKGDDSVITESIVNALNDNNIDRLSEILKLYKSKKIVTKYDEPLPLYIIRTNENDDDKASKFLKVLKDNDVDLDVEFNGITTKQLTFKLGLKKAEAIV